MNGEIPSRKLGPRVRQRIQHPRDEPGDRVGVLLATHGVLTDEGRARMEALGCHVRTVAGDVVTADLPPAALEELAALDFVRYVELSSSLHAEPRPDEDPDPPLEQ